MFPSTRLLWPVFAVSVGVLGFEIGLMRILLYASWHHFAFLVISVVLLGFGASGTVLCFFRRWLLEHSDRAIFSLITLCAVSMPLCTAFAQRIPVDARFVPALLASQVFAWVLYWALLTIPFFLGALVIGLALMSARTHIPAVYAANLAGSAVGAVLATMVMHLVHPAWLAAVMGGVALTGAAGMWRGRMRARAAVIVAGGGITAVALWSLQPSVRVDAFKYQRFVDDLRRSGQAQRLASAWGPRAVVEVYGGDAFHELPFLSVETRPPRLHAVVMDGHWAGSILRTTPGEDALSAASFMDATLMAVPYRLIRPEPRVLLLGETGGTNLWLALRHGAAPAHTVQPNAQLAALLRGPISDIGGGVFERPGVTAITDEPRHYVGHTGAAYDLIQVVSLQSWAVESGGVAGLNQDYLITVEGLGACLKRLAWDGVLAVSRGIEIPPRDNVKLLATLIAALRRIGIDSPGDHIVIVRDYLAACIMVKTSPWSPREVERVRALCEAWPLTPVYFAGIRDDELNRPDRLPGPPGATGDWLHHAATALLSADADRFIEEWPFDVRPPTDDRPFFANFTKLGAIGDLRRAYGDLWLTRTELALLFVFVAMLIIVAAGALLTVLPLSLVGEVRRSAGRMATAAYFAAIGLAYLMLEITLLSKLIHLLGDPVQASAVTIAGLLFFSGIGSLTARTIAVTRTGWVPGILIALLAIGIVEFALVGPVTRWAGSLTAAARLVVALALIGPLGFLMGFPMPTALRRLSRYAPALVPWAWGVNGFASVLAPPLATAIGMMWGFRFAGAAALVCYAGAAVLFARLPRDEAGGERTETPGV